jgi:pyrroline-5-carboxylate reductase
MPNLAASIGQGMSVAVANKNVSAEQHALCDKFLCAVGKTAWIEDEGLMDAVTALSGSGLAYVFALCEAMARAGESLGITPALASQLAQQTIIGSGALLAQSHESAEALRATVTSPGGTTEAALKQLIGPNGLYELMLKAMTAAAMRSKELALADKK